MIYRGMELFGGGATLAGLILGAIAVFIIDREFKMAAIYSGIGAVLAFFGFINGTQLVGAQPVEAFKKLIDAELAKAGKK